MINSILKKEYENLTRDDQESLIHELRRRFAQEYDLGDRNGIYGLTQKQMAYNSNRIEGSTLTAEQTAALFETGQMAADPAKSFRARDIQEMTNHFVMFNEMLKTIDEPLTEHLIKRYHFILKSGVYDDIVKGYPIGEYKKYANTVSDLETAEPRFVSRLMRELLEDYNSWEAGLPALALFHAEYESIHPFQDGNGRTGRIILFKECLKNGIIPFIITDGTKAEYSHALHEAQKMGSTGMLTFYFSEMQKNYYHILQKFLWET